MRRAFLTITLAALVVVAYSQKQPKPKINKANAARERGELAEAKEIIDLAIDYEKTKDDGKTWYYRGLIYATIDTTSNPQYNSLKANALETAMAAFDKADELGDKDKEYFIISASGFPQTKSQQIDGYYSYYFNDAVVAFQDEDYETAVEKFQKSAMVLKADTNSLKNAAYAAHSGELYDDAINNYKAAIEAGATSQDMHSNLIYLLSVEKKDNEAALVAVNNALEAFPGDPTFTKNKINLLIQMDKVEEAIEDLKKAIEAEPENTNLLFNLAAMYEETGDLEAAAATYDRAIAVDPDMFEANFNKGVLLLNAANEVYKEYSDLGISAADKKKARALEPKIKEKYQAALPQWERIYEIAPDDRQVVETLGYIYGRLKMWDKADDMEKVLDGMPEE
ncbi:tetratricopeptide repeat protein [Marinoscillum sp. MHG1-6]|uniref:tetratricopeptide repeat protein n=1 Tax=Marinoscillum sp. MHG1-6 TaxID=2959627 RepID=UPI00215832F1|nr:tetratricopeptide repeat protein [Marinoscillum sp. MHG1-6]